MKMMDYIDVEKTTIAVLKDWHNQQYKIDSAADSIASVDSALKRITPTYSEAAGGGSGNRVEEKLTNGIAKKDAILHGLEEARAYMHEFDSAWAQLSEEEQYVLRVRFIENQGGIKRIMDRFFIGKTEAYNKCNAALAKLSRLLFW